MSWNDVKSNSVHCRQFIQWTSAKFRSPPAFPCAPLPLTCSLGQDHSSFSPEYCQQQHTKMCDGDIIALVCDNNSGMCKAGFVGDDAPGTSSPISSAIPATRES